MNKLISKNLILISVLVLVVVFLFARLVWGWTNPSANPPSGAGALYYSNGNVGIGTTTPAHKFSVVSAVGDIARFSGFSSLLDITNIDGGGIRLSTDGTGSFGVRTKAAVGENQLTINTDGTVRATGDICTDQGGGKCLSAAGGGGMRIVGGQTFGSGANTNYNVSDANLVFLVLYGASYAGVGNYWLEKKADGWYISGFAIGGMYSSYTKLGTSAAAFRLAWADSLFDIHMGIVDINTFYFWTYAPQTSIVSVTKFAAN